MTTAVLEPEKVLNNSEILAKLWEIVGKPKECIKVKVINVYDNAYRINVWGEVHDKIHNIQKVKVTQSYFCKLYDDVLIVK